MFGIFKKTGLTGFKVMVAFCMSVKNYVIANFTDWKTVLEILCCNFWCN